MRNPKSAQGGMCCLDDVQPKAWGGSMSARAHVLQIANLFYCCNSSHTEIQQYIACFLLAECRKPCANVHTSFSMLRIVEATQVCFILFFSQCPYFHVDDMEVLNKHGSLCLQALVMGCKHIPSHVYMFSAFTGAGPEAAAGDPGTGYTAELK